MEPIHWPETSVNYYHNTLSDIPEDCLNYTTVEAWNLAPYYTFLCLGCHTESKPAPSQLHSNLYQAVWCSIFGLLHDPTLYSAWLELHKILTGNLLRVGLQFFDTFFLHIPTQFRAHIHWDADHWICSLLRSHRQTKSWAAFTHTIQSGSWDFTLEASIFLTNL